MKRDQLPDNITKNWPKRAIKEIKWLWASDWYDGPLSGMVEWNEQRYWAVYFEDDDKTRLYTLLKLTEEQQKSEEYWHELCKLCTGEDHHISVGDPLHGNKDTKTFYYTRYEIEHEELDWSEAKLVGWFKW